MKTLLPPALKRPLLLTSALLALVGCDTSTQADPVAFSQTLDQDDAILPDFRDFLAKVDGISNLKEVDSEEPDVRVFVFDLEQKLIHSEHAGETFTQRAQLHYKGSLAPTVLSTQGYAIRSASRRGRIAASMDANELRVEHRYFGESMPESPGYRGLRIKESSADLHSVVKRIRPLLLGSWISAGASKNGMTAMYHRRFYPFDTQATIAYVAPNSFGKLDRRYREFMDKVGTKKIRDLILGFQKLLLKNKQELVKLIPEQEVFEGLRFSRMPGGLDEAFERAVHELEFSMWQTYGARIVEDDGEKIPKSDEDLVALIVNGFFQRSLFYVSDDSIDPFQSYHIQTEIELGAPGWIRPELESLYTVDVEDQRPFLGKATLPEFDASAMLDMYLWTSLAINRTVLVYGDVDPYTAAAFGLSKTRIGEAYRFIAKNSSHSAGIRDLDEQDRASAIEAIKRWTGATWTQESETLQVEDIGYSAAKEPQALLQEILASGL